MKKSYMIFLVFLISGIVNNIYSKNTIFPGYIINLSNDTIEGFIDFKEKNINPELILFKNNETDKGKYYSPNKIVGFGVLGEIYKSAIVKVEQSPYKTNELSSFSELKFVTDTVFLKALIIGEKQLLYLKDKAGKEHFYIKNGSDYEWLIYKKYRRKVDDKTLIAANNKFIGQLILYLDDCKSINSILSAATYNQNSLIKVFDGYYECTNTKKEYEIKKAKVIVDLSALAGITFTNLKFAGNNFDELTQTDFPMSTNFTGGIAANIFLPRNLGRWSFNNELTIASYSTGNSYTDYTHDNRYIDYETNIAYTYLKLNNMLRGNFPVGEVAIFFDLGFSNGFALSNTNTTKKTSVFFDQVTVDNTAAVERHRNHEQSLLIGFGGNYKKFSATIRYEIGNGMSMYSDLASRTRRYYFFISYKLW